MVPSMGSYWLLDWALSRAKKTMSSEPWSDVTVVCNVTVSPSHWPSETAQQPVVDALASYGMACQDEDGVGQLGRGGPLVGVAPGVGALPLGSRLLAHTATTTSATTKTPTRIPTSGAWLR